MRTLLVLLLLIVLLGIGAMYYRGVLQVDNTPQKVNVTIDKRELEEQSEKAVEHARENTRKLLKRAGEALEDSGQALQDEAAQPATSADDNDDKKVETGSKIEVTP